MVFYRDGLALPVGYTGIVRIPMRPGWTLVFVGRRLFGVELLWRGNE